MNLPKNLIKPIAKAGYFSRGVVYLIIGLFACLAALGAGDKKDTEGAILELLRQPFGEALVLAMIAGLAGYVVWRLVQSLFDTDQHGWSPKGLAVRVGLLSSAFTYAALAVYAISLLGVLTGGGGGERTGSVADFLSGLVGSKMVSLGLATILTGVAIAHWYKAFTRRYADHFDASESAMAMIHPVSILGLTARGMVFAILSLLLVHRFLSAQPSADSPPGIKDAMTFLQQLPFGQWLLVALGAGLILFAGYSFIESVWRKINVEDA